MTSTCFIKSIQDIGLSVPFSPPWLRNNLILIECKLFEFKMITTKDLKTIICSLDNNCNTDVINKKVLKGIFEAKKYGLFDFVNTS